MLCRWPVTALAFSLACSSASSSTIAEAEQARPTSSPEASPVDAIADAGSKAAAAVPAAAIAEPVAPRPPDTERLEALLRSGHRGFVEPMRDPERFRIQLLVTTFTPTPGGADEIAEYRFRPDAELIYVASSIKTFGSIAALLELQRLQAQGHPVDLSTPMAFCSVDGGACQTRDPTNVEGGVITLGHELRKMHLVSNNHAFNRIYEWLGHRELNEAVWALGFPDVRIRHRFQDSFRSIDRRTTPRVELRPPGAEPVVVERRVSDLELPPTPAEGVKVGTRHSTRDGIVDGPKDFAVYNYASLGDLHRLTLGLVRPEHPEAVQLPLSEEHRAFLLQAMGEIPAESKNPVYDRPDAHFRYKLMLEGVLDALPLERVRYVNKPGRAHGFHLDTAYIEDTRTGRAMVVTASIHANRDGTVVDNEGIYSRYSRPYFRSLGEVLTRVFLLDETIAPGDGKAPSEDGAGEVDESAKPTLFGG